MSRVIISTQTQYTFGQMTNKLSAGLIQANASLERLSVAMSTASEGYTGTPGTQYEIPNTTVGMPTAPANLFGVIADSANPGGKGTEYETAVNAIHDAWQTFWAAASAAVQAIDNGNMS